MIRFVNYNKDLHLEKLMNMNLREADKRELEASSGLPWRMALVQIPPQSDVVCQLCFIYDRPLAFFGLRHNKDMGLVWAVATDEALEHWPYLENQFRKWLDWALERYPVLGNIIDSRNEAHVRWCKKMGFQFPGSVVEQNGHPFEVFYMTRKDFENV